MDFDKFTFRQIDADTRIKSFDCGDCLQVKSICIFQP